MTDRGNQISVHFSEGQFVVSYDLNPKRTYQMYDRVEVKEVTSYGEDAHITCALAITNSIVSNQTMEVIPVVQLGLGEGKYYAVYVDSNENEVIAKSDLITVDENEGEEAEVEDRAARDACSLAIQNLRYVEIDGGKNCEIKIRWEFGSDHKNRLSNNDYILVVPSAESANLSSVYYQYAFAAASGEASGEVSIRLAGYYHIDTECQVFYFDSVKEKCRGASEAFDITEDMLPPLDMDDEEAVRNAKIESQRYNTMAVMQYQLQDQFQKVDATKNYNPLLTITPSKDKWDHMIEENRKKYEVIEEEVNAEVERATQADDPNTAIDEESPDRVLSDVETLEKLSGAIEHKSIFLFCGAGISISAPSSSPSWWTLMSNVLEETFKAVPKKHQDIARKLRVSDASRSPEEVMETYYMVLQKQLFSLFELLNEGEPNANHRIIAKLAKEGKVRSIMTTNFDEFIEQALDLEGVSYRAICTTNEFQEYAQSGYKGFVVLKIHGTVSRPDTIVAVANHYKSGKGFGGVKSTVKQFFVKNFPTVYFGYSGWDFAHKNYQDFFDAAGQSGGESVYFVKYKGAQGGPSIEKLVGRHLGDRLVIGEAFMPDIACSMVSKFNDGAATKVMAFHQSIGPKVDKNVKRRQHAFVVKWVKNIPKISVLAILWNESSYLNDESKRKQEKSNDTKGELSVSVMDSTKATAYIMQLATEFGQGLITEKEYYKRQRRASMEMSFSYIAIPSDQKEELINIILDQAESNPLLSGVFGESILQMMPSYLMMAADASPSGGTSRNIFDTAIEYVSDILYPLYRKGKKNRLSEVMYNLQYSQSVFLRLQSPEDKVEAADLISRYAAKAVAEQWTDEMVTDCSAKEITPILTRLAYQQIDSKAIVITMVEHLSANSKVSVDETLEGAFIIAISLLRQAAYRATELYTFDIMTQIVQLISVDDSKHIPEDLFLKLEMKMNEDIQPVLDTVSDLHKKGITGSSLSPREVLATFDLVNAEAIKYCLKHIGDGAQNQRVRENCGYYPLDPLPLSAATYLSKKMQEANEYIEDDRAEQHSLAMLVALAEASCNVQQAQTAVDTSLAITEGKVTELTPVGIPEALAAMYQEQGDFEKALHYYKLSLDGIRTFISRQKTDAIVLNAVLVQAQFDKKAAMKIAFEYSPFFSDTQPSAMIGAGRSLLVQQCVEYAKDFSLSLNDAKTLFTSSEEDQSDERSGIIVVENLHTEIESGGKIRSLEVEKKEEAVLSENSQAEVEESDKKILTPVPVEVEEPEISRQASGVSSTLAGNHHQHVESQPKKAVSGDRGCNCAIM